MSKGQHLKLYAYANRCSYASKGAVENAHVDPAFRAVMEDRLLELGSHFGIEDFFSGWFRDAPFETIKSALFLCNISPLPGVSVITSSWRSRAAVKPCSVHLAGFSCGQSERQSGVSAGCAQGLPNRRADLHCRKGNVEDFIAYGFCAKVPDALSAEVRTARKHAITPFLQAECPSCSPTRGYQASDQT